MEYYLVEIDHNNDEKYIIENFKESLLYGNDKFIALKLFDQDYEHLVEKGFTINKH